MDLINLKLYSSELDTWYTPELTQPNRYAAMADLPANMSSFPVTYSFEVFLDEEPTGEFAYITVKENELASTVKFLTIIVQVGEKNIDFSVFLTDDDFEEITPDDIDAMFDRGGGEIG